MEARLLPRLAAAFAGADSGEWKVPNPKVGGGAARGATGGTGLQEGPASAAFPQPATLNPGRPRPSPSRPRGPYPARSAGGR